MPINLNPKELALELKEQNRKIRDIFRNFTDFFFTIDRLSYAHKTSIFLKLFLYIDSID
jgi:hypothetical protein